MSLLLDSDTCIALLRGQQREPRRRVGACLNEGRALHLSVISLHELWFGVAGSDRPEAGAAELAQLTGILHVLEFDSEDARRAGEIRIALKRSGTPIGPFDMLIAGQALARWLRRMGGCHVAPRRMWRRRPARSRRWVARFEDVRSRPRQ